MVTRLLNPNLQHAVIQFNGSPLPSYDIDPEKFHQILGNRPLYIVSPIQDCLPSGFEKILHDVKYRNAGRCDL